MFLLAENTRRKARSSPPEYRLDAGDVNNVDADAEDGHDRGEASQLELRTTITFMEVSTSYIAASTNRHPQAAAVSPASLLAFGSSNLIALWDIAVRFSQLYVLQHHSAHHSQNEGERGVSETLPGHEGVVTCVKFLSEGTIASADDNGFLICWRRLGSQVKRKPCRVGRSS